MSNLRLRPIRAADLRLLFEWRNDPVTVRQFLSGRPVTWVEHVAWFAGWLRKRGKTTNGMMWVGEVDAVPVGVVRYERQGDTANVSYIVAPEHRGKGYGTQLLELSAPLACEALGVSRLLGLVKVSNGASVRCFEKAGWRVGGYSLSSRQKSQYYYWRKGEK